MSKRIWIVAGEASGDARSAELMRAIHDLDAGIEFIGAGGPKMQPLAGEPFDNWIAEAGVLGLWDVLKNYGYFRAKFDRMLADIERLRPDAVLLVDYPGFNLRLAKALRKRQPKIRILFYVSPQVWAWNRNRIPKMARWLDLMLCIFPFEKPLYEKSGLRTEFVGHPIVEQMSRDRQPLERDPLLLGFFPGSREREVRRIFPPMVKAARLVAAARPDIRFEAAAASEAHAAQMREMAAGVPIEIRAGSAHELMQHAGVGIVCSGTATLEAACFGLPYALVYKTAWLTFEVGRRLIKVPHLGIINILAGRTVVRELIQDAATPGALADEALRLFNNPSARARLAVELGEVIATLHGEGASDRAARAVLDALPAHDKLSSS
ncbi:MAG TPA: lipid-A-disaccharide synthase [Chthoniobacterales bacterium]|nr:lipid-A-disaccharide synthase [Chthoniobacterales bacterium]